MSDQKAIKIFYEGVEIKKMTITCNGIPDILAESLNKETGTQIEYEYLDFDEIAIYEYGLSQSNIHDSVNAGLEINFRKDKKTIKTKFYPIQNIICYDITELGAN